MTGYQRVLAELLVALCLVATGCASQGNLPPTVESSAPVASSSTLESGRPATIPATTEQQTSTTFLHSEHVELRGNINVQWLRFTERIIQALTNITRLEQWTDGESLDIYSANSCEPNTLPVSLMNSQGLQADLSVHNCLEETQHHSTWKEMLAMFSNSKAVTATDRVELNSRYGIGVDTGTSYLVEQRYPVERFDIISILYLGSTGLLSKDWEEIGLVFNKKNNKPDLVAIYKDHFSRY